MVECHEDHTLQRGTWYLWKTGKVRIFLSCPACEHVIGLDFDDGIVVDDHGFVNSAVQCPNFRCKFLDVVQLKGWRPYN